MIEGICAKGKQHWTTSIRIRIVWNACSTYNLLAEEGRRVAAALLPHEPMQWK